MQSSRHTFFDERIQPPPLVNPAARPEFLVAAMNRDFEETRKSGGAAYLFIGDTVTGYSLTVNGHLYVDTSAIINQSLAYEETVAVCDIGAGAFGFEKNNKRLFGDRVINYGITATSFGAEPAENRYVGYNAECLSRVFGKNRFDLCFSRLTFVHFVDQIGSIIEAYKTLKVNGILFIDYFYITGCKDYIPHLISYLSSQGYLVTGSAYLGSSNKLQSFIIKKTIDKPILEMPFHYNSFDEKSQRVSYLPSAQFKAYCIQRNSHMFHSYRDGAALLSALEMNDAFKSMITDSDNLTDLFNHPHYQLADKEGRYVAILQIVSKTVHSVAELILKVNNRVKENDNFKSMYNRLFDLVNTTEFYSGLCCLARDESFTRLSIEDQQLIIEYLVVFDIVEYQQASLIKRTCVQMGISLGEVRGDRSYNGPDELLFPAFYRSISCRYNG